MTNYNDIKDDDVRIIGDHATGPKRSVVRYSLMALCLLLLVLALLFFVFKGKNSRKTSDIPVAEMATFSNSSASLIEYDTTVNDISVRILQPRDMTPELYVGEMLPDMDSNVHLAVQAAFIRADNDEIAGSFIYKGEQLSRGHSTLGFCAIIDGEMSIGNAKTTSLFEEAAENEGYFFRQKAMVDGGKAIHEQYGHKNGPTKSLRKALCYKDGQYDVVMSDSPVVLNDFMDCLVALGYEKAIGLSGSESFGWAKDMDGNVSYWGKKYNIAPPYLNYLVWKKK